MNITIIGTGYVGLVNAVCFAEAGHNVCCYDKDSRKIHDLLQGKVILFEPGLQRLIEGNRDENRLHFTDDLAWAISGASLCFLSVSTPEGEAGKAYTGHVLDAAVQLAELANQDLLLICKSTVPVGTCQRIQDAVDLTMYRRNAGVRIEVCFNPEFLRQGSAVSDCRNPDRIIVGIQSKEAETVLRKLYIPGFCSEEKFLSMDIPSAELTKYAANSILAARLSLINELANLSEKVGADIELVREGVGLDPRIGSQFLAPGCGYGGSCFPKDVKALIATGKEHQMEMRILQAVDAVNRDQRRLLAKKVLQVYGKELQGRVFAVWGLSFKPGTDDLREAPSLHIIEELIHHGASVRVYDPEASHHLFANGISDPSKVTRVLDKYEALKQADALLLVTEWQEFAEPDWHRIKEELVAPRIFDGRNLYDAKALSNLGFICYQIGTGIPTGKPAVKEAVE